MLRLQQIDHIALAVRDVERSARWYQEVLGLERLYQDEWGSFPAVVGVGSTSLALFPVDGGGASPPPGRDTLAMRHVAFRIAGADFQDARAELQRRGIAVEFEDHGIAHSIYFEDLDGHRLEITTYEPQCPSA